MRATISRKISFWCREEDLNLHGFPRWLLKPVRLPFRHPGVHLHCRGSRAILKEDLITFDDPSQHLHKRICKS